jgi:ABC-type methionine transport system ATPase subunit
MATARVLLTFPPQLIKEPVIYNIGKRYQVVTNIRRADVQQDVGWVILELDGDQDQIDQAIRYAKDLGVRVDPTEGNVSLWEDK